MEVKLLFSIVAIEESLCCSGCLQFVLLNIAFLYFYDYSESGYL